MIGQPFEWVEGRGVPGLALIGYRATGKSTVGRLVAERLGKRFLDADRELEQRAGRTINEIFQAQGEPAFRDLEANVLEALTALEDQPVLATGGGVVLRESNRRLLRTYGFNVWLTARPEVLAQRLSRDPSGRPSLTGRGLVEEVREVLSVRLPLYQALADATIDTEGVAPEAVAERVVEAWSRWVEQSRAAR